MALVVKSPDPCVVEVVEFEVKVLVPPDVPYTLVDKSNLLPSFAKL